MVMAPKRSSRQQQQQQQQQQTSPSCVGFERTHSDILACPNKVLVSTAIINIGG